MERLSDLINFLSKHKLKSLEAIGRFSKKNTLLNNLYFGIADKTFHDDETAAKALYNSNSKNKNFKKLKYELEKRLINNIFFIELNSSQSNDRLKAQVYCHRNWAAAVILLKFGGLRNVAVSLAERVIQVSLRNQLTSVTLNTSRYLMNHYSTYSPNKKKQKHYAAILSLSQKLLYAEILAETYFGELISEFATKKGAYSEEIIIKAKRYVDELERQTHGLESRELLHFSHLVKIMRYELEMDYEKVIKASLEANEDFVRTNDSNGIRGNNLRILVGYITLKKFTNAKKHIPTIISDYKMGAFNWFTIRELIVIFCFHSQQFENILSTYFSAIENKTFKKTPISVRLNWKIYGAYIHLFIQKGLIDPSGYEDKLKTFKLSKFLNDVPDASKDKKGANIQILIIQVIFLLREDKIDQAINRIQVLHQYSGKYLTKDYSYRSKIFIKMLIVLIRNQMHRAAVIRKSAKYLKLLKENPIEKSKQSIGVEVVPFEDLWELIIAETKNEFRFTPAKMKKIEEAFGTKRKKPATKK